MTPSSMAVRSIYTVQAEDEELAALVDRVPSAGSRDYGTPFYELFKRYNGDFFQIDRMLFSPAQVEINNLNSGRIFRAGHLNPSLLQGFTAGRLSHAGQNRNFVFPKRLSRAGSRGGHSQPGVRAGLFPDHPAGRLDRRAAGSAGARGECLEDCRALLVRTIPTGSLEQIIFRMDALHRLENLGVRVVNSASAIERTVDKYYTSFLLADAGIPTPRTLVTEDFETALAACREMGDVILKPLFRIRRKRHGAGIATRRPPIACCAPGN